MAERVRTCTIESAIREATSQFIPIGDFGYIPVIGMENEDAFQSPFNRMTQLGLIRVKDTMVVSQKLLMAFKIPRSKFGIPRTYMHTWEKFPRLPQMVQSLGKEFGLLALMHQMKLLNILNFGNV